MNQLPRVAFALLIFPTLALIVEPVPAQRITRPRVVNASQFPGSDLGAKINAADRALGGTAGEIQVSGGGRIATQIVVSANHTLRFGAGTYVSATNTTPILLKSGATLIGASWDAIILAPTAPGQFTVISSYNNAQRNGDADSDILIREAATPASGPAPAPTAASSPAPLRF